MHLLAPDRASPRLAVFGEWDGTNLGDHAILEGVRTFFHKVGWQVDAYGLGTLLHCQDLPQAYTQPQNSQISYSPKNVFLKVISSPSIQRLSSFPRTYRLLKRSLRPFRQQFRIHTLLPSLQNSHAILIGGGALLSDIDLHFPQSIFAIRMAAKHLNIPMFCLGCSLDGHWSPRGQQIFEPFLQSCAFIAVRDRHTSSYLSSFLKTPVRVFGDFAFPTIRNTTFNNSGSNQYILSLNVMQLPRLSSPYQKQYEDIIVSIAHAFMKYCPPSKNPYLHIFITDSRCDTDPAIRILERLSKWNPHLHIPNSVNELRTSLRSSTAILASRLHSAILSFSECTPVLGLSVGVKLKSFFESIGINQYLVSILDKHVVSDAVQILLSDDFPKQISCIDTHEIQETQNIVSSLFSNSLFRSHKQYQDN